MKVGELVERINTRLKDENPDFHPGKILKSSSVNGYKSQGFIKPSPVKAKGKAYFEYTTDHEELIYKAYSLIISGIRTNVAFDRAANEQSSLF